MLDYISSSIKESVHGLVYSDLSKLLINKKYDKKKVKKLTEFLESCSYLAYAPSKKGASKEAKTIAMAKALIKELKRS